MLVVSYKRAFPPLWFLGGGRKKLQTRPFQYHEGVGTENSQRASHFPPRQPVDLHSAQHLNLRVRIGRKVQSLTQTHGFIRMSGGSGCEIPESEDPRISEDRKPLGRTKSTGLSICSWRVGLWELFEKEYVPQPNEDGENAV